MDTTAKTLMKHPASPAPKRAPRRLRTIAEKRALAEETFEPGVSISVVARRHDLNTNLLFSWRKLHQAGLLAPSAVPAALLVPVHVKHPSPESTPPTGIKIVLPKGSIRLPGGIDPRMLQHIIEALT